MSDHRDSLIDSQSKTNPFELLQTIPVSNMDPTDRSYIVPQPRTATKSKKSRSRARRSEPTQSLAQGINQATQKLNQSKTAGNSRAVSPGGRQDSPQQTPPRAEQEDDLLGIFGDLGAAPPKRQLDRPALGNSQSQPHPHANAFDYWDPVQDNLFGSALQTPQLTPANSNSKASSVASSVGNEELFDPDMWELDSTASDFFDAEAQRASQQEVVQPGVGLVMPGFDENNDDDGEREQSSDESESKGVEEGGENKANDEGGSSKKKKKNDGEQEEDTKQADEPPTNCLIEMHRGTALLKYPRRHGFPHFKHVQLSSDNRRIQWFSKRKSLEETCIAISDIREIRTGQKTETFQKFHQEVLEKASFSIVFGDNYRTFDVVAKSTDECNMWVKALKKLKSLSAQGGDLAGLNHLDVGIAFKDRNRPKSRQGSGNFIRAHNSRQLKIDPVAQKQIERDMDALRRNYQRTVALANRPNITRSDEWDNISQVLSELEERIEELTHEVLHTRDTDMSKRDVWRANVDLTAIQEKTEVLLKLYDSNGRLKR